MEKSKKKTHNRRFSEEKSDSKASNNRIGEDELYRDFSNKYMNSSAIQNSGHSGKEASRILEQLCRLCAYCTVRFERIKHFEVGRDYICKDNWQFPTFSLNENVNWKQATQNYQNVDEEATVFLYGKLQYIENIKKAVQQKKREANAEIEATNRKIQQYYKLVGVDFVYVAEAREKYEHTRGDINKSCLSEKELDEYGITHISSYVSNMIDDAETKCSNISKQLDDFGKYIENLELYLRKLNDLLRIRVSVEMIKEYEPFLHAIEAIWYSENGRKIPTEHFLEASIENGYSYKLFEFSAKPYMLVGFGNYFVFCDNVILVFTLEGRFCVALKKTALAITTLCTGEYCLLNIRIDKIGESIKVELSGKVKQLEETAKAYISARPNCTNSIKQNIPERVVSLLEMSANQESDIRNKLIENISIWI